MNSYAGNIIYAKNMYKEKFLKTTNVWERCWSDVRYRAIYVRFLTCLPSASYAALLNNAFCTMFAQILQYSLLGTQHASPSILMPPVHLSSLRLFSSVWLASSVVLRKISLCTNRRSTFRYYIAEFGRRTKICCVDHHVYLSAGISFCF